VLDWWARFAGCEGSTGGTQGCPKAKAPPAGPSPACWTVLPQPTDPAAPQSFGLWDDEEGERRG